MIRTKKAKVLWVYVVDWSDGPEYIVRGGCLGTRQSDKLADFKETINHEAEIALHEGAELCINFRPPYDFFFPGPLCRPLSAKEAKEFAKMFLVE